jgi:hypothetical protein
LKFCHELVPGLDDALKRHIDVDWNQQLAFWKNGGKAPLPIHLPRPQSGKQLDDVVMGKLKSPPIIKHLSGLSGVRNDGSE